MISLLFAGLQNVCFRVFALLRTIPADIRFQRPDLRGRAYAAGPARSGLRGRAYTAGPARPGLHGRAYVCARQQNGCQPNCYIAALFLSFCAFFRFVFEKVGIPLPSS